MISTEVIIEKALDAIETALLNDRRGFDETAVLDLIDEMNRIITTFMDTNNRKSMEVERIKKN